MVEGPLRLDHCVIAVSDWERSNAFYRDIVGAELVEISRGRFAYRFENAQLNVHGPGVTPQPRPVHPVRAGGGELCLEWVGAIQEAVTHLERHQVRLVEGPVKRSGARGAGYSVYFRDPDGTLLEFISYACSDDRRRTSTIPRPAATREPRPRLGRLTSVWRATRRYKEIVRCATRLVRELFAARAIARDYTDYLIECVVYNQ